MLRKRRPYARPHPPPHSAAHDAEAEDHVAGSGTGVLFWLGKKALVSWNVPGANTGAFPGPVNSGPPPLENCVKGKPGAVMLRSAKPCARGGV